LPEWCTKKRFEFLKAFIKKETNLFIVIGIGGTSYLPNELYLVPFKKITSNKLSKEQLTRYILLNSDNLIDFAKH